MPCSSSRAVVVSVVQGLEAAEVGEDPAPEPAEAPGDHGGEGDGGEHRAGDVQDGKHDRQADHLRPRVQDLPFAMRIPP
jgi:hypothetical protein